jgi:thiopeptide-type bacteriocin biosynthesis protein
MAKNWISLHIFYVGTLEPLLLDAVEPLVQDLRTQGLLQRFFFIRYWQEGPHLRLRLLPTGDADREDVQRRAEEALRAYLQRSPSLYTLDNERRSPSYKEMFLAEYSLEKWQELYGESEEMPMRPNNSVHAIPYEPEYGRYGGSDGVELAEWHFEKSSELVLQLVRTTNLHVRSILLGLALQLAVSLSVGLLEDRTQVARFFAHYEQFWMRNYGRSPTTPASFEKKYRRMEASLQRRISDLEQSTLQGVQDQQPPLEWAWIEHVRELKTRLERLVVEKKLVFQNALTGNQPQTFDDPVATASLLLTSYIHMTNNRLGALILDEIYLAYLIKRTLEESARAASGVQV